MVIIKIKQIEFLPICQFCQFAQSADATYCKVDIRSGEELDGFPFEIKTKLIKWKNIGVFLYPERLCVRDI